MGLWFTLKMQALGIAALFVIFQVFEKRKAMRGAGKVPMPSYLDRLLRLSFLVVLFGPMCFLLDAVWLPYPLMSPLVLAYAFTYADLSEQRAGKQNLIVRKWGIWQRITQYFGGCEIVKMADLPTEDGQQYVIGVHPHSILPFGAIIGCGVGFETAFPGLNYRTLAATFCFYVPIYREILLWSGTVDAARYSAHAVLDRGLSVMLVPGGASEALYTSPEKDVIVLRKRRGFIKLALEHGANLVPVFSFNECNTYRVLQPGWRVVDWARDKFQRLTGLSLPIITNIWPRKTTITLAVGAPIEVPRVEDPSNDVVQEYLDRYIAALEDLYEANRAQFNDPPTKPPLTVL